jgi:hypothetical protein
MQTAPSPLPGNSPRRVLLASLIGTTIEFFDFYIYATAAVLVFPKLFFSSGGPDLGNAPVVCDLRASLLRTPRGVGAIRTLR